MSEKPPSSYEQAIGTFNASERKSGGFVPSVCRIWTFPGEVFRPLSWFGPQPADENPMPRFRLWRYGRRQK